MDFKLTGLFDLLIGEENFQALYSAWEKGTPSVSIPEAAKSFFLACVQSQIKMPVLVVTAQPENARNLFEQVFAWSNSERVKFVPEPDALPYQWVVSDTSTETSVPTDTYTETPVPTDTPTPEGIPTQ